MGSSLEELHTLRCSTIKDEILELGMVAHLGLRSWRPASVTQEDCLSNNKKDNNIPKQQPKPGFGGRGLGSVTKYQVKLPRHRS